MTKSAALTAIEQIVADLSEPITVEEQREGWNERLKARWQDWFIELMAKLESGQPVPPGWGILRAMDFDGIDPKQSSRLTRQASRIAVLLDERA